MAEMLPEPQATEIYENNKRGANKGLCESFAVITQIHRPNRHHGLSDRLIFPVACLYIKYGRY